jgi:Fe-S cluster assembly ATP-binding protein
MNELEVKELHVEVEGREILKGVNLTISKGEVVALMGPNGSGKSTLAYAIAGHPKYAVTKGSISFKGEDITKAKADHRARLGLFLSFQYPQEISGVSVANFLRTAVNSRRKEKMPVREFMKLCKEVPQRGIFRRGKKTRRDSSAYNAQT